VGEDGGRVLPERILGGGCGAGVDLRGNDQRAGRRLRPGISGADLGRQRRCGRRQWGERPTPPFRHRPAALSRHERFTMIVLARAHGQPSAPLRPGVRDACGHVAMRKRRADHAAAGSSEPRRQFCSTCWRRCQTAVNQVTARTRPVLGLRTVVLPGGDLAGVQEVRGKRDASTRGDHPTPLSLLCCRPSQMCHRDWMRERIGSLRWCEPLFDLPVVLVRNFAMERKRILGGLKAYLRATDHTSSNIISRD
jgi:hypothetical protein